VEGGGGGGGGLCCSGDEPAVGSSMGRQRLRHRPEGGACSGGDTGGRSSGRARAGARRTAATKKRRATEKTRREKKGKGAPLCRPGVRVVQALWQLEASPAATRSEFRIAGVGGRAENVASIIHLEGIGAKRCLGRTDRDCNAWKECNVTGNNHSILA
jgi:hypothetical protein